MGALASVGIRRATHADYPALVLVQQAVAPTAPQRDWAGLGQGQHFIYLAEDKAPFGFVCAGAPLLEPGIEGEEGAGEIIGWYLAPAYQGHGMGKKLLVRGLSVLKRRAFETAVIWLPDDAWRARLVIEQLAFASADMTRTTNQDGISVTEQGYRLSLDAYF